MGLSFFESGYLREREQLRQTAAKIKNFKAYLENAAWWELARVLPYLDEDVIDLPALKEALRKDLEKPDHVIDTPLAKVICMFDLMTNQREETPGTTGTRS
jgi:hypothetical protein